MSTKVRRSLTCAAAPLIALAAAHLLYALFGHAVVRATNEGTISADILAGVVESRDGYPIERYYLQSDLQFRRFARNVALPTFIFSGLILCGGLLAPWTARKMLALYTVVAALIAACFVVNRQRVDVHELDLATDRLLRRAKEVADRAPSFRQEDALAALPASTLNGFVHWLDKDLAPARLVLVPALDQASSGPLVEFKFGATKPASFAPQKSPHEIRPTGTLHCRLLEGDTLTNSAPINVALNDVASVEIRMRNQHGKNASISWSTTDPPESTGFPPLTFRIEPGPEFHTYSVRMGSLAKTGKPRTLRAISLRPTDAPTDDVEIESIKLNSRLSQYAGAPVGISYESLRGEIRRVIHARLPSRIAFSLRLPGSPSFLTFGTGVLKSDLPVTFTVSVSDGSKRTSVFQRTEMGSAQWNDVRIDLSSWAGKAIEIELGAEGAPDNVAFWSNPGVHSPPTKRFNVVILLQDALRGDRLAHAIQNDGSVPVIQQLAQSGVVFTNAFSQETKTRPSVPSLLTSLLPSATGVWSASDELSDRYLTLPEILRDQGFATALFTQNPNVGVDSNLHQGFGVVFNDLAGTGTNADEFLCNRLMQWIEAQSDRNFFLYIHLIDPHGPYDPPPPRSAAYEEAVRTGELVPRIHEFDADWVEKPTAEGRRILYDAEIALNDRWIGRLLEVLGTLRDDTVLILCSDHGESLGEHGIWGHKPPGHRVAIHVPLILVYPKALPAGRSVDQPVQLIDVMPTVLDLAKIDKSGLLLHGESLLPLFNDESDPREAARLAVSEEFVTRPVAEKGGWGSLMFENWHFLSSRDLLNPSRKFSWLPDLGLSTRVFNTKSDPKERNFWNSFMLDWMIKARLNNTLLELEDTNKNVIVALDGLKNDRAEMDPEVEERLRALGYLK